MSTTGFLINEEMVDLDPDVLLTPGAGESWWFEEVWVAGVNDDSAGLNNFIVEYVSDGQDIFDYVLDQRGVDTVTTHKHFISRYQQGTTVGYILRALPDCCVPDGCRLRLIEAIDAFGADSVIVHAIGVIIDSTDEVSHAEKWANLDPDTIIQPAAGKMIRWEMMFIGATDGGTGVNLLLRRQGTGEQIIEVNSQFEGDPTIAFEYEVFKNVDGVTAVPANVLPMFIPGGYEMRMQEALGIGDFAAVLLVGREYSTA